MQALTKIICSFMEKPRKLIQGLIQHCGGVREIEVEKWTETPNSEGRKSLLFHCRFGLLARRYSVPHLLSVCLTEKLVNLFQRESRS